MIELRPFTDADLPAAHALTTEFGWPHRLADWTFMSRLGTGVVAEQDGHLVGTAHAWRFGTDHGAIGLIGVSPLAQRQGLGRRVTVAALDRLEDRTVVLHATAAGFKLYETLGFVADGTVRQHQGAAYAAGLMKLPPGRRLRPIGRSDAGSLIALDRSATGQDRTELFEALLEISSGVMLDGDDPVGFALLRRFGRGHVIGPVVAPDAASAQALISHLLGQHAGEFIRIDMPEAAGLSDWLQDLGLAGRRTGHPDGPRPACAPRTAHGVCVGQPCVRLSGDPSTIEPARRHR